MNRIYRLVYNHTLGLVQVASELGASPAATNGAGYRVPTGLHLTPLALGLLLSVSSLGVMAQSLPSGGNIVSGSGQIGAPSGNQLIINQASDKLAINWQSFNIGAGQKVTFNQPGANSIALNRVLGVDGSKIMGQLDANGRVFLVNPNGVLFGASAQVNVGGLVASTLGISDADFAASNYRFKGDGSNAAVINHGSLNTSAGGAIALLGGTVSNHGVIVANQGSVALAAGNAMTLDFAGNGLFNVQVDEAMVDALVENHQLIKADGGQVLLTAHAGDALLKTVINNTGVIQARTLGEKDGKIVLLGSFDGGTVQVDGTLDASAPNGGNGGFIDTSGAHVALHAGRKVTTHAAYGKTGSWLIDPNDFTIAASGGNITGAQLSSDLTSNNVVISTISNGTPGGKGDIHVNDNITYAQNTLTLNAENNINVNATISVNGSGTLALNYGGTAGDTGATPAAGSNLNVSGRVDFAQAGTGLLSVNGHGYTVINSLAALQALNNGLSGKYALGGNMDASATAGWNSGAGFAPIGNGVDNFTGSFDGLGHTISNLTINRPWQDFVGLFGYAQNATLRNIGLLGGSITGQNSVGGLVGLHQASNGTASITNVYATGQVTGKGTVTVGGLVGLNWAINGGIASINNAYATGQVNGENQVGGLVGYNYSDTGEANIANAYATGQVTGIDTVGGLVGFNSASNGTASIANAYATGQVAGTNLLGGLVGHNDGSVEKSFYATTDASGSPINSGAGFNTLGTGKTLAELKRASTFSGWSIDDAGGTGSVWRIYEGNSTPLLRSFLKAVTVTSDASGITGKTYDGIIASGTTGFTTDVAATLDGSLSYATSSKNAGTYSAADGTLTFGGLYSGQQGYDISYAPSSSVSLTITRKALTVSGALAAGKTYDGSLVATITGGTLSGMVGSETVNLGSLTGAFADKNAGSGKAVSVTGGTLSNGTNGGLASNYSVDPVTGLSANIAQKALTVTGVTASNKVYDATTIATITGGTLSGLVAGETLGLFGLSGSFANKNAGTAKAVTVSGATLTDGTGLASNYTVSNPTGVAANIYQATISSVTNVVADSKVYDGDTRVTFGSATATFNGMLSGDSLAIGATQAAFSDKNAGTGKAVNITSLTLGGADAGNYVLGSSTATGTGTITPKALTISGMSVINKVYDGTTKATLAGGSVVGLVGSENIGVTGLSARFDDKNAGTGKTATATGAALVNGVNGGLAANYTISNPTGLIANITPKALSLAAATDRKTYDGTTASNGNVGITGLVSGDSITGLGQSFDNRNAGSRSLQVNSGYVVNDGNGGNNYNVTITGAAGSIDRRALTVTANSASKIYGDTLSFSGNAFTTSGLQNGETINSVDLSSSGSAATAGVNGGTPYTITASNATGGTFDASNYTISYANGGLTITPRALLIAANSASKIYGAADNLSHTDSGLVNGDTLSGNLSRTAGENVGSYAIGQGSLDNPNYAISFTGNNLSITPRALTITANNGGKTYGQSGGLGSFSSYGLVNGDTVAKVDLASAGTAATANVGDYTITASNADGTGLSNYDITYANGVLSIGKAGLTITAGNGGKTYGQTGGLGSYSADGLLNNDTISSADLTSNGTAATANVGNYTITASNADGTGLSNYDITYVDGTLSIGKAGLTITAGNGGKTYGQTGGLGGYSADGLLNNDTVSSAELTSNGTAATTNVGNYTITASNADGTGLSNYDITYVDGTLSIGKAGLTITAGNGGKTYGQTGGLGGYSVEGLLNNDTVSSADLTSNGTAATTNVGNYTITASNADGTGLSNYDITYVDGVLSIGKAGLTITAGNGGKTYGQTGGLGGYSVEGLLNNDTVSSADLTSNGTAATTNVGNYTITASNADGTGLSNYDITYVDGVLSIGKAGLIITANNTSKNIGQPSSFSGYTAEGLVNGDSIDDVTLFSDGSALNAQPGGYAIFASDAQGARLGNYDITYREGTLDVVGVSAGQHPQIAREVAATLSRPAPRALTGSSDVPLYRLNAAAITPASDACTSLGQIQCLARQPE